MKHSIPSDEIDFVVCSQYKNVPYIGYYKLTTPAIVLCDADLIKQVLVSDQQYFAENDSPASEKYDPLMYENPFFLNGERWKRSRNVMVPTMTAGKVSSSAKGLETLSNNFK